MRNAGFNRDAQIGDLAASTRRLLKRTIGPLAIILAIETAYTIFSGRPGGGCFAMISTGTILALSVWQKLGRGLPLMPLMAVQSLIAYGLPIAVGHNILNSYSAAYIFQSGVEVLIFGVTLSAAWTLAVQFMVPKRPVSYAFEGYKHDGADKLARLGSILVVGTTVYLIVQAAGFLDTITAMLPTGSGSILVALIAATSTCGFFLLAMLIGAHDLSRTGQIVFWVALVINCLIDASGFLLSTVMITVISVAIGFFWSTGRLPWRYLTTVIALLAFFNIGKYEMRAKYWVTDSEGDPIPTFTLDQMPDLYLQWIEVSIDDLAAKPPPPELVLKGEAAASATSGHSLFDRINNLQNLLYVIDAEDAGRIEPVHGATYTMIPMMLIPRIISNEKVRSQEGQVLLNVHFNRQDLHSTYQTYIAWGLLAEAYGNFGPIWGSIFLGSVLGFIFAWIENFTQKKLVMSMEGFVAFAIFLGFANSFEMVASVLVTSIYQAVIPIGLATLPFVQRRLIRPHSPDAPPPAQA